MRDYWIDDSDPPYPTIRHREDPGYIDEPLITLTEARQDIKERCRIERQHWLSVMHTQLARTPSEMLKEALDTRGEG